MKFIQITYKIEKIPRVINGHSSPSAQVSIPIGVDLLGLKPHLVPHLA